MKIIFEIYYHTRWGESLFLSGDIDELGANEENRAVMMDYQGDGLWKYTMELPASAKKFHYEYLVKSGEGIRREWGSPHSFSRGGMPGNIVWSIDGAMFLPICLLFIGIHSRYILSTTRRFCCRNDRPGDAHR